MREKMLHPQKGTFCEKGPEKYLSTFFAFHDYLPQFCFQNRNQLSKKNGLDHFGNWKCQ